MKRGLSLALCGVMSFGCSSDKKGGDEIIETGNADASLDAGDPKTRDATSPSSDRADARSIVADDGGNTCETKSIDARPNPPDVLILLDRSLSMLAARWAPATTAVKMLTSEFDGRASFGLMTFPFPGTVSVISCQPGVLDVPVAPRGASAVNAFIDMTSPDGLTPTANTLRSARDALVGFPVPTTSRSKPGYVLLVTDGEPDCGGTVDNADPREATVEEVAALLRDGIKTYVVGMNLIGSADLMNRMAQAGGTDKYFEAASQQELSAAFHEITKTIVKCDYELDAEPTNPTYVRVTIDGKTIPYDTADGWVIDAKKITLRAASCDTLNDGSPHTLAVQVECAPVQYQ